MSVELDPGATLPDPKTRIPLSFERVLLAMAMATMALITAANVLAGANAKKRTGVAGATITAGQTVYEDSTDSNKFKLAGVMVLPSGTNEFSSSDRLDVVVPQLFDKV
jgi:hypothetical protein